MDWIFEPGFLIRGPAQFIFPSSILLLSFAVSTKKSCAGRAREPDAAMPPYLHYKDVLYRYVSLSYGNFRLDVNPVREQFPVYFLAVNGNIPWSINAEPDPATPGLDHGDRDVVTDPDGFPMLP